MAIELNPKYADAYDGRGAAYEAIGNKSKAKSDLNKAYKIRNKR